MVLQIKKIKFSLILMGFLSFLGFHSLVQAIWTPPHAFTTDGDGDTPRIGSDAQGNGMALYIDGRVGSSVPIDLLASYYTAGAWQTPVLLDSDILQEPVLAMDASGKAIAVWRNNNDIKAKQFNGTVWGVPTIIENLGDVPAVAMNGNGKGIAVWFNFGLSEMHASFFNGFGWTFPVNIGASGFPFSVSVAYSANGSVVVGWNDASTNNFVVNNFVNGSWQGTQILGSASNTFTRVAVGTDASGNALGLWADIGTLDIVASFYNGTAWQPSQIISPTPGTNGLQSLAMSSNGTAIAAWPDSSFNGLSSTFNGITWETPIQFGSGLEPNSKSTGVSIDPVGNAAINWTVETGFLSSQLFGAQLPSGSSAWVNQELIQTTNTIPIVTVNNALSASGTRFVIWLQGLGDGALDVLGAVSPSSAVGLKGKVCKNSFASQSGRVKTISWKPSLDSTVVAYELRRNGELIATIPPKGPFTYKDYNRCKQSDVYTLTVVYSTGLVSEPLTVTVK